MSHTRSTRSSGLALPLSGMVVTGVNFRGLMPCSRCLLIDAATVFLDTVSPSSRRSAKIRGDPYTSSEACVERGDLRVKCGPPDRGRAWSGGLRGRPTCSSRTGKRRAARSFW